MAEVFGITEAALRRWAGRLDQDCGVPLRRGRPEVIPVDARHRIRACYVAHYGQWGPRVLAQWCRREGIGNWSATTIAGVIRDLRDEAVPIEPVVHYEITASGVMWSEDGTGFRDRGRKKELLVIQDEHARFKLRHRLVDGPADEEAVYANLKAAFSEHGAPLVLKHDGGSIFHGRRIRELLAAHQVTELTGPGGYPQYNGKQERSMRDIKSYERAMRYHGVRERLRDRLDVAVNDLNEERPRPVLGGRTAYEAYEQDHANFPDRNQFIAAVNREEEELRAVARSRSELESSRRRAIEQVLLRYGLMQQWCDVSHNVHAEMVTN